MSVEITMFSTPCGNIRGLGHVSYKDKSLMVVHLFTDRPAEFSSKRLPSRLTASELLEIAGLLEDFVRKVTELDA